MSEGKPIVKPIVQLVSPEPITPPKTLAWVDGISAVASAGVRSGLIAAILAALETIDLSKLTAWQAFTVSFLVLVATTLTRLYNTGPAKESQPSPPPDGPAPDPDVSIPAKTAA